MAEYVWAGREYAWIWLNLLPCSEYFPYNTLREVTLQVYEYLLRDGLIQNPVKDQR